MTTQNERGVSRILQKLKSSLESGEYYEAHQLYRTLYFRYLRTQKYTELLELLYDGAITLLQKDQQGSGADLAILIVDVLTKSSTTPNELWIERLGKLFSLINGSIPERETFMANSIKWSMDESKRGHALLHQRFAETFWREKCYNQANRHFMFSTDGALYAQMLIEMQSSNGDTNDVDLIITQAVLRLLCLRNLEMATTIFNIYTTKHPAVKNVNGPPFKYPLLDFLWYLIKCIENKDTQKYQELRALFGDAANRDESYSKYLDKIGKNYFDLEVPVDPKRSNPLGNFIKSMMVDGDSSGDESEPKQNVKTTDYDLD